MKKLVISPVDHATSEKLIRQYLKNHYQAANREYRVDDHIVRESRTKEYVKLAYFELEILGPLQNMLNEFLRNRLWVEHFAVPVINSVVVEEMIPHEDGPLEPVVHWISLDTGKATPLNLTGLRLKGVRTNRAELIMQTEIGWEWILFNLTNGSSRPVYTGGNEFYLSKDGNLFFPVEGWSKIALVDLVTGKQLDTKNKRHFSRYGTKVKILQVIHFDPKLPCLFVLLMKQQKLSFASLKKEVCIKLTVTESPSIVHDK